MWVTRSILSQLHLYGDTKQVADLQLELVLVHLRMLLLRQNSDRPL